MRKYVMLYLFGIMMFYTLQSVSPALGFLMMATSFTLPFFRYSLRVARIEDERCRREDLRRRY
jgi:hypothetical protein